MISEPYKSPSSDGCDNVVVNPSRAGQFAYLECATINPAGVLQQFLRCKSEISLAAVWAHFLPVSLPGACFPLPARARVRARPRRSSTARWRTSDQCQSRQGAGNPSAILGLCLLLILRAARYIISLSRSPSYIKGGGSPSRSGWCCNLKQRAFSRLRRRRRAEKPVVPQQ